MLIDDELSTGNTFCNLLQQCLHYAPSIEQVFWVSIADFIGEKRHTLLSNSALTLQIVSLLQGQWQFISNGQNIVVPIVSQANVGHEPEVIDTGLGRLGIGCVASVSDQVTVQIPSSIQSNDRVLVLGCGEFMHAALMVAEYLEQNLQAKCWVQSSTRSPILKWGAINSIINAADPYEEGVPYFLYNVDRRNYDYVLVCHEQQANKAMQQMAYSLQAHLISFAQEYHD